MWPQNPSLVPPTPLAALLTAQHGDSRSSQRVLCQQQTNWDYYLLAFTCQDSCLTQGLIIIIIYFLPHTLRAQSRAMFLWELLLGSTRGSAGHMVLGSSWGSGRRDSTSKGSGSSSDTAIAPLVPSRKKAAGTSSCFT